MDNMIYEHHHETDSCACSCGKHQHFHESEKCICEHGYDHAAHDHSCCAVESHHEHSCSCESSHHDHHHHEEDSCGCGCGCGHDHGVEEGKSLFLRIGGALAALIVSYLLGGNLPVLIVGYSIAAFPVLKVAFRNILHGEIFDEMFLMSLASLGAIAIGEFEEGIAVLLLYQLGEYLQDKAVDSSRRSIRALMDIRPDSANVVTESGIVTIPAKDVVVGSIIEIRVGDKIPLDGLVLDGTSTVDTAALTGESVPREVSVNSEVLSGCVNLTATLHVRVTKPYGEDSASRILALVEDAQTKKAKSEQFIRRFARVYTPIVVISALILAFLPPLLGFGELKVFVQRALNFLVISCPCALVISVPLTFFSGLGAASSRGILIKGANYLETISKAEIAAFDKTGTLTEGKFSIYSLHPQNGCSEQDLLELAAYAESQSNHPLAKSILDAYGTPIDTKNLQNVCEYSGNGISALWSGKQLLVGKASFLAENGIAVTENVLNSTTVHVAYSDIYCGAIELLDRPKRDAKAAIAALKSIGLRKTAMLSGDRQSTVEAIGSELGLDEVYGELLPEDKLAVLDRICENLGEKGTLLYAGDGINDTPVLASADVGIAMGALGTDAAMETADIVIMSDEPAKIPEAILLARKTVQIAKQNIVFSLAVKVFVLALSSLGYVNLWAAVFADVGVCMLTILNALRAMK